MAHLRSLAFISVIAFAIGGLAVGNRIGGELVIAASDPVSPLSRIDLFEAIHAQKSIMFSSASYISSVLSVASRSERGKIRNVLRVKVAEQVAQSYRAYTEITTLVPPPEFDDIHVLHIESARLQHEAVVDQAAEFFDQDGIRSSKELDKRDESLTLSDVANDLMFDAAAP